MNTAAQYRQHSCIRTATPPSPLPVLVASADVPAEKLSAGVPAAYCDRQIVLMSATDSFDKLFRVGRVGGVAPSCRTRLRKLIPFHRTLTPTTVGTGVIVKKLVGMLSPNRRKCEQTGVQSALQQSRECRSAPGIGEKHHG